MTTEYTPEHIEAIRKDEHMTERELRLALLKALNEIAKQQKIPTIAMQQILDVGLNAFGLQLFAESVAGKTDKKTFDSFAFIFRGIKITLEPHGEVDTRHH